MKKIVAIFLMIAIFKAGFSQVSETEVFTVAKNFIAEGYSVHKNKDLTKLYHNGIVVGYVVNLEPQGFVIVTANKNTYPVFGFSYEGNFVQSVENQVIVNILKTQLYYDNLLHRNYNAKNRSVWDLLLEGDYRKDYDYQYGYWLTDVWGGVNCYDESGNIIYVGNYYTPNHYSPGCVAVSTSQVLHYYNWPPRGSGTHTDYDNSGSSQGSYYAKFVNTYYDWANMLDEYYYKHSTDEQRRAVGLLMYHAAIAVDMDFEYDGSTSNLDRVPNALMSYFRMVGHFETRSWSSFVSRLQENLRNAHPVLLAARADNGDEHAFVCDGYRYNEGEDVFYHLNMGWWNAYGLNGWYRIFADFNVGGYNTIISGVFDILPVPYMDEPLYTEDPHKIIVRWKYPKNVNVTAFELQESYNNGDWVTVSSSITDTFYVRTVANDGLYKYRVRPQIDGIWYADTYSGYINVPVGTAVYLNFDGDDSFFVNDNIFNDLDVSDSWTFEAWVKVDSYDDNDWSVIMDRRTVFSMYLINDYDADFAVRFVARDGNDNIIASLRSDSSAINLSLGQWFHVAATYDGDTARLFINGYLVDKSADADFNLTASTNALNIAARYWGAYSRYLDGKIDEIRVSDIARYKSDFCPSRFLRFKEDAHTRLLLHLDNYTGTSLYDASHHLLGISLRDYPNDANWQMSSVPVILSNPKSKSLCYGETSFGITAYNSDTYRWQVLSGLHFENLQNSTVYSGVNTDTLTVENVSLLDGRYYYRCLVTNADAFTCSEVAYLNALNNCTVWNGTVWSNGEPDENLTAVIDSTFVLSKDLTAENIIVNANDTLLINPGYAFVSNYLENYGTVILKSSLDNEFAGALITPEILNYGKMQIEVATAPQNAQYPEYQLIISPALTNSLPYDTLVLQGAVFYGNEGGFYAWERLDSGSNVFPSKAYLLKTSQPQNISFEGTFFTGEKTFDLKQGWNLIFNPYPAPINFLDGQNVIKAGIKDGFYVLKPFDNGNSLNFSVFDGVAGIHSPSAFVGAMQGIWVYAYSDFSEIKILPGAMVKPSQVYNQEPDRENCLVFEFENAAGRTDQAAIYFSSNSENLLPKIEPLTSSQTYTYLILNAEKQSVAKIYSPVVDTVIPVGFQTAEGGDAVFRVLYFDFDVPVYLKDMLTGQTVELQPVSEYDFYASTYQPLNRFKLYFNRQPSLVHGEKSQIRIYSDLRTIWVFAPEPATVQIYDLNGRLTEKKDFVFSEAISGLKPGVYFVKVISDSESKIRKVLIIK